MKSWGCVTLNFVLFLSIVNLSKESCFDYYEMQDWGGNLSVTVSLVKMKDPKDTMECTLESECQQKRDIACHLLEHCFEKDPTEKSEKCKEAISQNSSTLVFYHFMCLSAKAFDYNLEACQYDTVCQLNTEMASTVFDQTSLPPPVTTTLQDATTETTLLTPTTTATKVSPSTTTATKVSPSTTTTTATKVLPSTTTATKVLPSTTTATKVSPSTTTTKVLPSTTTTKVLPSTTTTTKVLPSTATKVLPSATTTATKLLPPTTTAIPALPPTATTLAPAVTQRVSGDNGGTGAKNTGTEDTSIHSILYPLSVIANVILVAFCLILMALYRRLYHKCRQERTPWGLTIESNATLAGEEPGDQPMTELQSDTSSTNGDSESRHLMQPSVIIHADDVTSNWSAIEEGGQH